jgi:Flp pilus assembly protein TadD/ADP-heptose:LPS heptosyltransferase
MINKSSINMENRMQKGISFHQKGELQQAEQLYQQVLQDQPQNANAYHLLGIIAYQVGRHNVAIDLINQAIGIDNRQPVFFGNLGNILQGQKRQEEAIQAYQHAIELNPENEEIQNDLGNALTELGHFQQAVHAYHKVVKITPNNPNAYYNLGNTFRELGQLQQAIEAYGEALALNPNDAEIYNNLGTALQASGQLHQAARTYHQAIEKLQGECERAHYNLGTLQLLTGDFKNGWQQYQWRWKCDDFPSENRPFHQPSWNGSNLSAKTILVWAEQGIGDEIMFASMLNDLRQSNANIMVECEQRLISLFQRSFPDIRFFCRTNPPDQQLLNPNIDYQISMGSLGQWLRTDLDSFKQGQSYYLTACPDKTAELRNKYQQLASGRKLVGISWKSTDISQRRAKSKSTSLEYWASVLSQPNCYFINLQYGDIETEVAKFESDTNLKVYQDKEIDPLVNLDGFAAQISALDLVISTSNTTVHMAGALGKRVWTLLPHIPDWRWTLDREDALWYPAMRLFRQSSIGDWQDVFKRVSHALSQSGMV